MMDRDVDEAFLEPRGAAEWFLAIHAAADPSPQTVQGWLKWLDASPDNRQAFEELVEIWDRTPAAVIATRASDVGCDEYDGSVPVAQWRALSGARNGVSAARRAVSGVPVRGRRRSRWMALAATVIVSGGMAALYFGSKLRAVSQGDFSTGIGEQRQLRLADDSTVLLGPGTRLSVDLTATVRDVRLSGGEAYFSVARDPKRPFTVHALNGAITAVGTAFDVRAIEDRVTVIVTEGRVALTGTAGAAGTGGTAVADGRTLVGWGEQVSYSPNSSSARIQTSRVQRVNTGDAVHWREGWLVYRNEPLRYVVADIARYSDLKFQLSAAAADIQFSGAVHRDKIGEWIVALPEVAAVTVTRDGQRYNIDSRVQ